MWHDADWLYSQNLTNSVIHVVNNPNSLTKIASNLVKNIEMHLLFQNIDCPNNFELNLLGENINNPQYSNDSDLTHRLIREVVFNKNQDFMILGRSIFSCNLSYDLEFKKKLTNKSMGNWLFKYNNPKRTAFKFNYISEIKNSFLLNNYFLKNKTYLARYSIFTFCDSRQFVLFEIFSDAFLNTIND